ncbi:hypothetical protein [Paenibacillus sp. IITD108]
MKANKKDTAKQWYSRMEQLFRQELDTAPMSDTTIILSERYS